MIIRAVVTLAVGVFAGLNPTAIEGDKPSPPPPVALQGARSVSIRDTNGGLQRYTAIPSNSVFVTYRSGPADTCSFTASSDDFLLSSGERVPQGTVVTSNYLFVESIAVPFDLAPAILPNDALGLPSNGPISSGTRTFSVFCDRTYYHVNFIAIISVPFTDTLFDPRSQVDRLYQNLRLQRPTVFTNPVVDTYGGLITRYPAWLAIRPDAWRTQQTTPLGYRGLTLLLIAQPRRLDFVVTFTPNPAKPSPPFRGIISCIPSVAATANQSLPAFPTLADQAEPGPNGPCQWTPPGPGTVTITAQITYAITFWASGYTESEPDYTWTSNPTTYLTGDLTAVNTDPVAATGT